MTLDSTPRYDPEQITEGGGHAVVVGASMAGLLATRVLTDHFETVTLIEKDSLPDDPVARPGVPQAQHLHVMHKAGQATLEDFFPGYGEELIGAGALVIDLGSDIQIYNYGDFLADGSTRIPVFCASRRLFEQITRRRVAALDRVSIRDHCQFVDYLVSENASTVRGVTVRTENGNEEFTAELVVDATGRTSRTPAWLDTHGYPAPSTDEVTIDLAYSTATIERPKDSRQGILVITTPPETRGVGLLPIENERWLMTQVGIHGDHPPTDVQEFVEFANSVPGSEFKHILDEHALASEDISYYPFPSNVRRRYEDLERFPDGLVVMGDAIASFNPVYGQGMSIAALEALQLHHTLAMATPDGVALRFFDRIEQIIEDAWTLAVTSDFRYSQTSGPKPFGTDVLNRYFARLTRKAHTDERLADAFYRVTDMEQRPISLFRPGIMWRVLKPYR